jgi:hypothetical protein
MNLLKAQRPAKTPSYAVTKLISVSWSLFAVKRGSVHQQDFSNEPRRSRFLNSPLIHSGKPWIVVTRNGADVTSTLPSMACGRPSGPSADFLCVEETLETRSYGGHGSPISTARPPGTDSNFSGGEKIKLFRALFRGREDVYAVFWLNFKKSGPSIAKRIFFSLISLGDRRSAYPRTVPRKERATPCRWSRRLQPARNSRRQIVGPSGVLAVHGRTALFPPMSKRNLALLMLKV